MNRPAEAAWSGDHRHEPVRPCVLANGAKDASN